MQTRKMTKREMWVWVIVMGMITGLNIVIAGGWGRVALFSLALFICFKFIRHIDVVIQQINNKYNS